MFTANLLLFVVAVTAAPNDAMRLESSRLVLEVDTQTGEWSLLDKSSGVRWPTTGKASPGTAPSLTGEFAASEQTSVTICLRKPNGTAVTFTLQADGGTLEIGYQGQDVGDIRVLDDAVAVTQAEAGAVIVPCREGLLIPADSHGGFRQTFGTSDYEGCHMNMLGFLKSGSTLAVTWDDAYVWPEVQSSMVREADRESTQRITTGFSLRRSARTIRLTPLGKGDWNTLAAGYRRIAEQKGLAVTLQDRIRRNPHAELLAGAANIKLWTCLERQMSEESTKEESVKVHWTFDEAAAVAEHLAKDVGIARCLFMMGGWTEGGYDCRHPDNLPANAECGGNDALAAAIQRIRALGYLACFTRTDNGWAAGLHPTDAFLKTTHEVLGPLHQATADQRLVRFEYLAPDRSLRRAVYGDGLDATTVVVNFGAAEASVQSALWGDVLLPPWGFVVDGPRFTACYAKRAAGREYPDGTLFALQAIEGPSLVEATKLRVFHGFGDPQLTWRGKTYLIPREEVLMP